MNKEDNIISEIKVLLIKKGWTQEKLAKKMSTKLNKKYTAQNLGNKLRRETIPYREIKLIAEILGYKIIIFCHQNLSLQGTYPPRHCERSAAI